MRRQWTDVLIGSERGNWRRRRRRIFPAKSDSMKITGFVTGVDFTFAAKQHRHKNREICKIRLEQVYNSHHMQEVRLNWKTSSKHHITDKRRKCFQDQKFCWTPRNFVASCLVQKININEESQMQNSNTAGAMFTKHTRTHTHAHTQDLLRYNAKTTDSDSISFHKCMFSSRLWDDWPEKNLFWLYFTGDRLIISQRTWKVDCSWQHTYKNH